MSSAEYKQVQKKMGQNGLQEGVEQEFSAGKELMKVVVILLITRLVGFAVAFGIFILGGTAAYEEKISKLTENSLGYVYVAATLISLLTAWLNLFPTYYKSKVFDGAAGNLRANLYVYKANYQDGQTSPYVVMEEGGGIGQYNRANRSLHHYGENVAGVLVCSLLAGYVFPFPAFILTIIFAIGRILHQVAYAEGGYGKHAPGFAISMIGTCTLEMLVALAGAKSFM